MKYEEMDLVTDVYTPSEEDVKAAELEKTTRGKAERVLKWIF